MRDLDFHRKQISGWAANAQDNSPDIDLFKGQMLMGYKLAERNYYPADILKHIPQTLSETFIGTGNPFLLGELPKGATIIDVCSGGGMDAYLASRMVGPTGKVYGIESSREVLNQSIKMAKSLMARNLTFLYAWAEYIPLPDEMADIIISNGMINIQTETQKTLAEIYRILKPNGKIQIADAIVTISSERTLSELFEMWSGFHSSIPEVTTYRNNLMEVGFREVQFSRFWPVLFRGRQQGNERHLAMMGGHILAVK